ncbi:MAG: phosphotransferase [Campylobacterota bacterium]|nr:phosphotransferase [Campylobacterota bacterium]
MDKIQELLKQTSYKNYTIEEIQCDNSFKNYFRLSLEDDNFHLIDFSLTKDSAAEFVDITRRLLTVGVKIPEIIDQNIENQFLIVEDLGGERYSDVLDWDNFEEYYKKAIDKIIKIQKTDVNNLSIHDKTSLHSEMNLMQKWYFEGVLRKALTSKQKDIISTTLDDISSVVLSQPQKIFIHKDFNSKNISIVDDTLSVINSQNAMSGAVTYDLVSLLKDCHLNFEEDDINRLALYFRDKKGLSVSDEEFIKWFDFMGLQRHIKLLGVFSQSFICDGKKDYLKYIPLTLQYVFDVSNKYEETKALTQLLKEL